MSDFLPYLMVALLVGGAVVIIHLHKTAAARQGTRLRARDVLSRFPDVPENAAESAARKALTRSLGIWLMIWLAMNLWIGFTGAGRH